MDNEENVKLYLQECVTVDEMNIKREFIRLSSDLSYWSAEAASRQRAYQMAKIDLERAEATALITHRNALEAKREKVTEAMVSAMVNLDLNVRNAKEYLIECEADRANLNGVVEAIKAKKEMLISLGATVRAENSFNPTIRDTPVHRPYVRNGNGQ